MNLLNKQEGFILAEKNYLWTIKIEELPFGAEGAVLEAMHDYPKGKTILLPPTDWNGDSEEEFFFDPIGFKQELIALFNHYAAKAKGIMEATLTFQERANQIIALDAILYSILYYYLNQEHDASTLDSSDVATLITHTDLYFKPTTSHKNEWLDQLNQYKFLKLTTNS